MAHHTTLSPPPSHPLRELCEFFSLSMPLPTPVYGDSL